jgi:hypothetical protein
MSTIKANYLLDASGGNTAQVNGITPTSSDGVLSLFNATGSAPVFACRAWANIDVSTGSPVLRAGGNVSSLTDVATGTVRVNFVTALEDANYAAITMCGLGTSNSGVRFNQSLNFLTTSVDVNMTSDARAGADGPQFHVAVFR